VLLFYCINLEHIDAFFLPRHKIDTSAMVEIGLLHFLAVMNDHFHSSFLWNQWHPSWCFRIPNYKTVFVGRDFRTSVVRCDPWAWQCSFRHYTVVAIISVGISGPSPSCLSDKCHLCWPLKQNFGHCRFYNNKKVEITVGQRLQMQEPNLYCDRIFRLMPGWDKRVSVLGDYINK
jgi:hypothetical protein